MARIETISFDGDDTLWHTQDAFESVEERFRTLLARYLHGEAVSEHLYGIEMRNLRRFGYGAKGFILSLIETAIEVSGSAITAAEIEVILSFLRELLDRPVTLLEGVRETLARLSVEHNLVLLTKGDLFDQELKIARSGLAELFSQVRIVSEKNDLAYSGLLSHCGTPPAQLAMVGNSLRSDILPAIARGIYAIHIPYHVTWKHESAGSTPESSPLYRHAETMAEVPSIIRQIGSAV